VSTRIHSMPSVAAIPDATLGVLTGVGHSVHWAAPDLVVAAVEDVARRIEDHMRAARPATAASAPSTSSQ
jgi:pimeloyl-ACP methyl ester carboxylesterase